MNTPMNTPTNRSSSPLFLTIAASLEVLILLAAGISLFLFSDFGRSRWVWSITPYNTVFLGAVYLAALVPIGMLAVLRRHAIVRLVLMMQFTFTTLLLATSILYLDHFNFQRKLVWGWFVLYISIPIISAYYLWQYRRSPSFHPVPLSTRWRMYLFIQTIVLGGYGLGLLLQPTVFSAFWPWTIDAFHGRLYSAVFLVPAVAAWLLLQSASAIELLTVGVMQLALGLLPIVGVAVKDMSVQKIDWTTPETWLWIALFAGIGAFGLGEIGQAKQNHRTAQSSPTPVRQPEFFRD